MNKYFFLSFLILVSLNSYASSEEELAVIQQYFPSTVEESKRPLSASERSYIKSAPSHKTIKTVNVEKLMPLMVKLIQEQQAQIEELKSSKN